METDGNLHMHALEGNGLDKRYYHWQDLSRYRYHDGDVLLIYEHGDFQRCQYYVDL